MPEEEEEDEFYTMHFVPLTVKNYQKSTVWFMLAIALCALRAAKTYVIILAYI